MISVQDFLRAVNESGRVPGSSAFLVDFGGVQNVDDPTIARALVEHFEQATAGTAPTMARLTRHVLACLCPDGDASGLIAAIDELNGLISEQGLGAVRWDRFVLPRDGRTLADRIRGVLGGLDPARAAGMRRDRRDDLAQLLRMEQMLRQADISSLMHHQAIYDFAKPRSPVTLARELTVSLERLTEQLGIAIARNPWLLDKATLLLDRRMLFHIVQDRSRHDAPFAINLRTATVLEPGFPDMVGRLAAGDHETMIVELGEPDRQADAAAFEAAIRELDRLGIHVAFHAGGWDNLRALTKGAGDRSGRFLRHLDFIKVRWDSTDLDLTASETAALSALVQQLGAHRIVLERAETEAAIEFAARIGVRLLQGFGVTAHVQAQQARDRDRAAARTRRASRQSAEPAGEPKEAKSALRKMFRL